MTSALTYNEMVVGGLSEAEADRVFHAMADKTRRDILARVVVYEQSISSLSRQYEMSFAAVQKHVAVLEHAELVSKRRQGREQIVRANTSTVRRAVELLDSYEQLWVQRAKQITELLAKKEGEADDRRPL